MPFKKGEKRPPNAGRKQGSPNKYTGTVKEMVLQVFQQLQEDPNKSYSLVKFAQEQPAEFYKISARLIPTEVNAQISEVRVSVDRKNQSTDISDAQG